MTLSLPPYLFILYVDVLSSLIHREIAIGSHHGLKVACRAPQISHLLLADDSLMFSKGNTHEADVILNILLT